MGPQVEVGATYAPRPEQIPLRRSKREGIASYKIFLIIIVLLSIAGRTISYIRPHNQYYSVLQNNEPTPFTFLPIPPPILIYHHTAVLKIFIFLFIIINYYIISIIYVFYQNSLVFTDYLYIHYIFIINNTQ